MRILPVIDLMGGLVVRGVAGRRHEYRPIVSRLTPSCKPLEVARAFRAQLGLDAVYVADLDAIGGSPPASDIYVRLLDEGFALWVDAGIGSGRHVDTLAQAGVQNIIAGLESLDGPAQLQQLVDAYTRARLVFSLDMKNGQPLGRRTWSALDPWGIAQHVIESGVERILVLDLAGVGSREGTLTDALCKRLHLRYPRLEISTGGGIRDAADLQRLREIGVDYALVASALHDGWQPATSPCCGRGDIWVTPRNA